MQDEHDNKDRIEGEKGHERHMRVDTEHRGVTGTLVLTDVLDEKVPPVRVSLLRRLLACGVLFSLLYGTDYSMPIYRTWNDFKQLNSQVLRRHQTAKQSSSLNPLTIPTILSTYFPLNLSHPQFLPASQSPPFVM